MALKDCEEDMALKDDEEDLADPATKRSSDSKLMITKEGKKVEQTTKLEEAKESKRTKKQQREVLEDKIENLHNFAAAVADVLVRHATARATPAAAEEVPSGSRAVAPEATGELSRRSRSARKSSSGRF